MEASEAPNELKRLVKNYDDSRKILAEADTRLYNKYLTVRKVVSDMEGTWEIRLADLSKSDEGRDLLDLWEMARKDQYATQTNVAIAYFELECFLTQCKLGAI